MTHTDEWTDITNEIIIETNPGEGSGSFIFPKWPGKDNLRVLRKKEKENPLKLVQQWDGIAYSFQNNGELEHLRVGVVKAFNDCDSTVEIVNRHGETHHISAFDIVYVWRNGEQIYKA